MARLRSVRVPVLKDWSEVDAALREIGEAQIRLDEIEGELTRRTNEIRDEMAPMSKSVEDRIKELTGRIEDFVEAHRDDFGDKKTRVLNFGETGWRQSTTIKTPRNKDEYDEVIRRLRARNMDECVKVTEKVEVDALRKYGEDVVRAVGARWIQQDKFWCEANREKLQPV